MYFVDREKKNQNLSIPSNIQKEPIEELNYKSKVGRRAIGS
jgi:hypothetical protein